MHFKISILSTNCFMAIYEILFNVDSIQALQCEIFSYVYELNLYSVYSWQIIILLELSRHPIELSIKLIVLSILFYSSTFGLILHCPMQWVTCSLIYYTNEYNKFSQFNNRSLKHPGGSYWHFKVNSNFRYND